MEFTAKLYSLTFREYRTYLFVLLFVIGNMLLPRLCHIIPGGGLTWLPIYFFTLIAAYKYGLRVGLLTAILSPLINYLLFGMPTIAVLPVVVIKSSLLAAAASYAAYRFGKISLAGIILSVIAYQLAGMVVEGIMIQNFSEAVYAVRMGAPGMVVQILGGFLVLRAISKL